MTLNNEEWITHLRNRAERERKADLDFRRFIDYCNRTPFEETGPSPKRRAPIN